MVVVTGTGDTELERQAMLAGAHGCLKKPVARAEVAAALRPRSPAESGPSPGIAAGAGSGSRPRRGRGAGDPPDPEEFLAQKGYDVRGAADGASAITAVAVDPPDVVLLDIMRPGLDGVNALAAIRAHFATALMMTWLERG